MQVMSQLLDAGTLLDNELYSYAHVVAALDAVLWAAMAHMNVPPYAHFPKAAPGTDAGAGERPPGAPRGVDLDAPRAEGQAASVLGDDGFLSRLGAREGGRLPPPCGHIGLAAREELWGGTAVGATPSPKMEDQTTTGPLLS